MGGTQSNEYDIKNDKKRNMDSGKIASSDVYGILQTNNNNTQTAGHQHTSSLDAKIIKIMKGLHDKRLNEREERQEPFTKILLKFPLIKNAFNSIRNTFNELDQDKGYINRTDLNEAFKRLGGKFTREEINEIFHESDLFDNDQLDFKEFLVCLALAFVLHKIPSLENTNLSIFYSSFSPTSTDTTESSILFGQGNKLRNAFQLAIDSFIWFDVDGDGLIQKEEMVSRLEHSMYSFSPTKSMSKHFREKSFHEINEIHPSNPVNQFISDIRFHEMDWDNDGYITFKEFLMAFESWVGIENIEENFQLESPGKYVKKIVEKSNNTSFQSFNTI